MSAFDQTGQRVGAQVNVGHDAEIGRLQSENERLRGALYTIARGVWTAPNSIETIVWTARQALKPAD